MEIPFIVNARKDTGLFNSKVGIWLFLASEVTLFGGLFSGYLFLRLYADYPWPERALPVLPGLINTFILIGSSVTVVFAWAALKMREWAKFQIYMGITLVCAVLFLGLKAVEYNAKFHHQGVRLTGDGSVQDFGTLEGHVHKGMIIGDVLVENNEETINSSIENQGNSRFAQFESGVLAKGLSNLKLLRAQNVEAAEKLKTQEAEIPVIEDEMARLIEVAQKQVKDAEADLEEEVKKAEAILVDASDEVKAESKAAIKLAEDKVTEAGRSLEGQEKTLTRKLYSANDAIEETQDSIEGTTWEIELLMRSFGKSQVRGIIDGKLDLLDQGSGDVVAQSILNDELKGAIKTDLRENMIDPGYANKIIFKANELTFTLKRPAHEAYVREILKQAGDSHTITLVEDYRVIDEDELHAGGKNRSQLEASDKALVVEAGKALSIDDLDDMEEAFLDARAHDKDIRTEFLRASWAWIRNEKGIKEIGNLVITTDLWKDRMAEDAAKIKDLMLNAGSTVTYKIDDALNLVLDPTDIPKLGEESVKLRDDTVVTGQLLPSPMLMGIDAIDFRHTAMRAEEEDIDPIVAIEQSWIFTHKAHHEGDHAGEGHDDRNDLRKAWDCHMAWLEVKKVQLKEKNPDFVPTKNDMYRVNWDQMVAYEKLGYDPDAVTAAAKDKTLGKSGLFDLSGFAGANHSNKDNHFPHVVIPRDKVGFTSTFTPRWNTYYAIYFTITGLHGLHVIGGILVLGYYMFFGRKMYDSNPEWLANRVEVGGLFWHFVDLVWIFLFPILYLM